MPTRQITGTPSQIMVEQLRASGVTKVFYNSGSREAPFFDALHESPDIHGILALHEGSVTAMAGGYTQVRGDPAVTVVHLGAGLAQCLGQLINVAAGGLPVVVVTFAGDTGSFGDMVGLDLDHSFGPTSISAPFTKASWTVIEPEGLPSAIERALKVAKTPPMGPVHLAVYDRLLDDQTVTAGIIDGPIPEIRSGHASDEDLEVIARTLHDAERPLIYAGEGVWKSGAESSLRALAERFGAPVALPFGDLRGLSAAHPLYCGRIDQAAAALDPDHILCIGGPAQRRWPRPGLLGLRRGAAGGRPGLGSGRAEERPGTGPRGAGRRAPFLGVPAGAHTERVDAWPVRRPAPAGAVHSCRYAHRAARPDRARKPRSPTRSARWRC